MSVGTSIEWTHIPGTVPATMNALVGCRKVSAGCKHCYAIGVAHLRAGNALAVMQEKFGGTTERVGGMTNWTGKVTLREKALLEPLRKRKPHTYFVNSMSDLFYEGVPDEWIDRHYAVFALCPQHTFIVLTKRPERMQKYLSDPDVGVRIAQWCKGNLLKWAFDSQLRQPLPRPNVWHLVSVEDQKSADERIPLLLQTPSAVRGVSCEPLLGPVSLGGYGFESMGLDLDWVICGGESGAGAGPMHPDWARGLRDQCQAAGVPFFFKQWGEWAPHSPIDKPITTLVNGTLMFKVGKKAAGHLLDGREWHQFPEVQHAAR